ncbi:hypothetical protein Cni_G06600 [Canna indica]|uniref:Uncharacterized protein n=1 Tax=Canna indica TaxID=4628 RepID=A0AAQ3JZL5_9LILI|nr:hypothetical protein Cni_G06600 [Canna indica]
MLFTLLSPYISNSQPFLFSTIYANTNPSIKNHLWLKLYQFDLSLYPWRVVGDFNCILDAQDKKGGLEFKVNQPIRAFRSFIVDTNLIDLGYNGSKFTWCNNRKATKESLLDLIYVLLIRLGCTSMVKHLTRNASDHNPLLLELNPKGSIRNKLFKFQNFWTSYNESFTIVQDSWPKTF